MGYRISYVCTSHRGLLRQTHQDNFLCGGHILPSQNQGLSEPLRGEVPMGKRTLFGVFDGMGGEEMGEMASYIAARTAALVSPGPEGKETLSRFCRDANLAILRYSATHAIASMGTTATVLAFSSGGIWLCHLGDSRAYRFRGGVLTQLTQDQGEAWLFGRKSPLSQYLGMEGAAPSPQLLFLKPQKEDIYLLCSDGLTDLVGEGEIRQVLWDVPYPQAAPRLQELALTRGGRDNVTILTCKAQESARKPMCIKRLFGGGVV